jgi:histidinol phosphatase-like PHP family hydrolase
MLEPRVTAPSAFELVLNTDAKASEALGFKFDEVGILKAA